MNIKIEITDQYVLLHSETGSEPWVQPLNRVGDVRDHEGKPCSEWILHLSSKSWCSKDDLYQLASTIRKLKRDSDIDWRATFQVIERLDYLDQANKLRNYTKPDSGLGTISFADIGETIQFNSEDNRTESQPVIDKEVEENLAKYNLL